MLMPAIAPGARPFLEVSASGGGVEDGGTNILVFVLHELEMALEMELLSDVDATV